MSFVRLFLLQWIFMNNNNIPIQMNQNPVNKTCKQRKPRSHYLLKKPWRKKNEWAKSLTKVSSLSLVFFFFFSIVITHNVNKKRDAERKGSSFPSWESKVGEKEKQFWLSDPLRRPERRTARDEREREFGTMVIVEFLRFLWFT